MTRNCGLPYAAALAALSVSTSTGCLLYTDPINVAPTVEIEAPEVVHRQTKAMFGARVRDPDGDRSVRLEWSAGKPGEACPATMEAAAAMVPEARHTGGSFAVDVRDMRPFCVWAIARDEHGARSFATRPVTVTNQKPAALIQFIQAGPMVTRMAPPQVPLYSQVRLTGEPSMDNDKDTLTEFEWTVVGPRGVVPVKASGAGGRECAFSVLVPGQYAAKLRVKDGMEWSEWSVQQMVANDDAAPCIRLTTPPHGDLVHTLDLLGTAATESKLPFEVAQVQDDGDPYPAPAGMKTLGTFIWALRAEGETTFSEFKRDGQTNRFEVLLNSSLVGTDVEVRATYRDREGDRVKGRCDANQAVCSLGEDCPQWVTWKVRIR